MRKRNPGIYIGITIVLFSLLLSVSIFINNFALPLIIGIVGIIFLFFTIFENKYVSTEKIVVIALLSSLASSGRIVFSSIPSVQPASFVIIITGIVFGSEMGFITGAICALVSNLVLGQGPWTIWQMFCWGMMGFVSGQMSNMLKENKIILAIYGLIFGLVFGWVMNCWFLLSSFADNLNWETIITAYITSFPMDLSHGICNLFLLVILGEKFIKILNRVAFKYGLTTVLVEI